MPHLALSKYLPVYAIPQAAPSPCPSHPVATSTNDSLCKRRDQMNLDAQAVLWNGPSHTLGYLTLSYTYRHPKSQINITKIGGGHCKSKSTGPVRTSRLTIFLHTVASTEPRNKAENVSTSLAIFHKVFYLIMNKPDVQSFWRMWVLK